MSLRSDVSWTAGWDQSQGPDQLSASSALLLRVKCPHVQIQSGIVVLGQSSLWSSQNPELVFSTWGITGGPAGHLPGGHFWLYLRAGFEKVTEDLGASSHFY